MQTMADESSTGFSEQFKELVTQNEQRMKAIQEQIAGQWESQRKSIADLIEQQWKAQHQAIADLIEQQRSGKTAEHWEAQRKAITDQVEQQWNAQLKAITDRLPAAPVDPSAEDRSIPGLQCDEAIQNCFGQTVECDYLSFLRAREATQVTHPSLLPGVDHPLKVHIQLGAMPQRRTADSRADRENTRPASGPPPTYGKSTRLESEARPPSVTVARGGEAANQNAT